MNRCEFTGRDMPRWKLTKTEDGKLIDINLYRIVTHELQQGLVHSNDVIQCITMLKKYNTTITKYIQLLRKYSVYYDCNITNTFKVFYAYEDMLSITMFNTYKEALNKKQHIQLIEEVIQRVKDNDEEIYYINLDNTHNNDLQHYRALYLKTRESNSHTKVVANSNQYLFI